MAGEGRYGSGKKGEKWEDVAEIFHYNEENQSYKSFKVQKGNGGVYITATEGVSGDKDSRTAITIKLDEKEVAYLALKLQKLL